MLTPHVDLALLSALHVDNGTIRMPDFIRRINAPAYPCSALSNETVQKPSLDVGRFLRAVATLAAVPKLPATQLQRTPIAEAPPVMRIILLAITR